MKNPRKKKPTTDRVEFYCPPKMRATLDRLAKREKMSRDKYIHTLVEKSI